MKKQIKDLKAGEFFTLKDYGENEELGDVHTLHAARPTDFSINLKH